MCRETFIRYACGCAPIDTVIMQCNLDCETARLDAKHWEELDYSCNKCQQDLLLGPEYYNPRDYKDEARRRGRNPNTLPQAESVRALERSEYWAKRQAEKRVKVVQANPERYKQLPNGFYREIRQGEKGYIAREQNEEEGGDSRQARSKKSDERGRRAPGRR